MYPSSPVLCCFLLPRQLFIKALIGMKVVQMKETCSYLRICAQVVYIVIILNVLVPSPSPKKLGQSYALHGPKQQSIKAILLQQYYHLTQMWV